MGYCACERILVIWTEERPNQLIDRLQNRGRGLVLTLGFTAFGSVPVLLSINEPTLVPLDQSPSVLVVSPSLAAGWPSIIVHAAPVSMTAPQLMRSPTRATALPSTNVALAPVSTVPSPWSGQLWRWPTSTMGFICASFCGVERGVLRRLLGAVVLLGR